MFGITEGLEQYRLRAYNPQHKIMTETYSGREDHLLPDLAIHSFKTLILEQKDPSSVFEEYDPTVMTVKINIWREGIEALGEDILKPKHLKVPKSLPFTDFCQVLTKTFSISCPQVMKRNPMLNQQSLEKITGESQTLS